MPNRRSTTALLISLTLAATPVVAGCGGDDAATPKQATTTTSRATTTTTEATTTTAATTTLPGGRTTTTARGATTVAPATTTPPAATDPVPDGNSFGYLKGVDVGGSTITIDIAELLTGDAAVQAAIDDGHLDPGATSIDNDYYIRNRNPKVRTAPVTRDATIRTLDSVGSPDLSTSSITRLAGDLAERSGEAEGVPVKIVARGGFVSHVEEVFFP